MERPRALAPSPSHRAGRLARLSEGASGFRARSPLCRALSKPHLFILDFLVLSAHSLSKQPAGDGANLQSAVVFRKTVYTPLTRLLRLLGGPSRYS